MAVNVIDTELIEDLIEVELPDVDQLVTEDDTPVDNLFSEKQQRLLTESLYSSWPGGEQPRSFLAAANVALYYAVSRPAVVPDMFLSLDVEVAENWYDKRHRSYFFWEFGKPPEIVIEVVSNEKGGEDTHKLALYARIGVEYYIIFDPQKLLSNSPLRAYERRSGIYRPMKKVWFAGVGLGLTLWEGAYEGKEAIWLRWCDEEGQLISTGAEGRRLAEMKAAEEAAARLTLEQEVALLKAELERLKQG